MKILKLIPTLALLLCASCRAQPTTADTTNPPGTVGGWQAFTTNLPARFARWFNDTTNAPGHHFTLVTNTFVSFDTNVLVLSGPPNSIFDGEYLLGTNYTGSICSPYGLTVTNAVAWYDTNYPAPSKFIYFGPVYNLGGGLMGTGFAQVSTIGPSTTPFSFGTNVPGTWMGLQVTGGGNANWLTVTNSIVVTTNYP